YDAVISQNGGIIIPGNSPGTFQTGTFTVNGGGNVAFQITDAGPSTTFPAALGAPGVNPGWSLVQAFTNLNFTATAANKFTITLQTQLPPPSPDNTAGSMADFDPTKAYSWLFLDPQGTATVTGTFDPAAISFNTTGFANTAGVGAFNLVR